jgi:hypothetical protein
MAGHHEGSMYKELKRVIPTAAARWCHSWSALCRCRSLRCYRQRNWYSHGRYDHLQLYVLFFVSFTFGYSWLTNVYVVQLLYSLIPLMCFMLVLFFCDLSRRNYHTRRYCDPPKARDFVARRLHPSKPTGGKIPTCSIHSTL